MLRQALIFLILIFVFIFTVLFIKLMPARQLLTIDLKLYAVEKALLDRLDRAIENDEFTFLIETNIRLANTLQGLIGNWIGGA